MREYSGKKMVAAGVISNKDLSPMRQESFWIILLDLH